jgi:hypothetical protein
MKLNFLPKARESFSEVSEGSLARFSRTEPLRR